MSKRKNVRVTKETSTGRNIQFHNTSTGENMSLPRFVGAIKNGRYPGYHIKNINGVDTPASNPDKSENNNLG